MALCRVQEEKEIVAQYLKEVLQQECKTWLVFECYYSDLSFVYYMHINESYGKIPSMGFKMDDSVFRNSSLMEIKVELLKNVFTAVCQLRILIEVKKLNNEITVL